MSSQPQISSQADSTTAPVSEVTSWRVYCGLAVLVLLTIISYVDRTIILLLVEPIKADLGISDVQFSLLTGLSFAVFYALFGLPFGWLADRFSRRWIIFCGVTAWSIATATCGLATSFLQLFAARMGVGIGEATLNPAGYAIVGDMFSRRRLAMAIGILAAGTSLGASIAFVAGGQLIEFAEASGGLFGLRPWQSAIVLVAVPGLLLAPLVFIIPRSADRTKPQTGDQLTGYWPWLKANLSHLAPMTLGAAHVYTILFGITAWLPALLFRDYAHSPAEVGAMLGLAFGITGVIGFIGNGWIVDLLAASNVKHGHLRYMMAAIGMMGMIGLAAFTLASTSTQIMWLVAGVALFGGINGPALAYIQLHAPATFRARTIALFLLVFNLFGMTIGPSAVALASERLFGDDVRDGMALLCAVGALSGALMFALARRNAPDSHAPHQT